MCFLLFEKTEVTAESIAPIAKQDDNIYGEEIVENKINKTKELVVTAEISAYFLFVIAVVGYLSEK